MLIQIRLMKYIVVSVAIFALGTTVSLAKKSKIQEITSAETTQDNPKNLPSNYISNTSETSTVDKIHVHSVGVGVGQTFVVGDFKDNGEDKITFDLLYNYRASYSFDLAVTAHHSKHSFQDRYVRLSGVTIGIKARLYQFDSFSPYILGGFGFYNPKVKRYVKDDLVESKSKVIFGTHFGAGGELQLNNKFAVGILAHYHNPFDVKQELGPEIEGSYSKLLITGLYTF